MLPTEYQIRQIMKSQMKKRYQVIIFLNKNFKISIIQPSYPSSCLKILSESWKNYLILIFTTRTAVGKTI